MQYHFRSIDTWLMGVCKRWGREREEQRGEEGREEERKGGEKEERESWCLHTRWMTSGVALPLQLLSWAPLGDAQVWPRQVLRVCSGGRRSTGRGGGEGGEWTGRGEGRERGRRRVGRAWWCGGGASGWWWGETEWPTTGRSQKVS